MKLDTALAAATLKDVPEARTRRGGGRLRRPLDRGDQPRPVPAARARRRAHRADQARHVDRGRLSAQPAGPRADRVGPAGASGGRFILGLGTQVQGPQRAPLRRQVGVAGAAAARDGPDDPRDLGLLAEQHAAELQGQVLRFTLMTPFFNAGPIEHPNIPIYIAGVNSTCAALAGELCDGFHVHPFHSHQVPARGHPAEDQASVLAKAGRDASACIALVVRAS